MIRIELDVMLARRKMTLTELSRRLDIALPNLSILKNGHAKAIRMALLDALCRELDCQPGNCWCGNRTTRQKRNNHP